jgi:hypothetical protein
MEKQVEKTAYRFEKYCGPDRWASFYFQLKETLALKPKNVLEIGVGNNTFRNGITADTGILYESLDIAEDLHPTHVGSVDKMPLADKSFDAVCAFEILEHLPFEKFEKSIGEIARVSRKHAVISLPHFGPPVKFLIKLPFLPEMRFAWKFPYPRKHVFDTRHYWEIGKREYPVRRIRKALEKFFVIKKEFVPFEHQYHHFFVLEKKE